MYLIMKIVQDNNQVTVHYKGTLKSGEVFDTSREREPLEFTVGAGQMIPGFENAVKGMQMNEVKTVTIAPADAYGETNPEMVQKVPKSQLPEGLNPFVGQQLSSKMEDGQEIIVRVADVQDDHIKIDANHPLAGEELTFEIEVVSIT
jgi:FKBP-type peptidyl-prolyl cis-trans isomerase 2